MQFLPWFNTTSALVINAIIGLFTLTRNPKSATSQLFSLFVFTLALYLLINQFSLLPLELSTTLFWMRTVMIIALAVNILFFLLVKAFPSNKLNLSNKSWLIILLTTLPVLGIVYTPLLFSDIDPANRTPIPAPGMVLFLLHTIAYLGTGAIILIKKWLKAKGVDKIQLNLFLLGTLIMFILILVSNVLLVLLFNISTFVSLLPIYTSIFAATIAYAIIRHRFLDISALVTRAVSFTLLTVIIAVAYAGGLLAIPRLLPSPYHDPISVVLAVLIAFTFHPLRKYLENFTEAVFHKGTYQPEVVLEQLSSATSSTLSINTLTDKVDQLLGHTLHPSKLAFFLLSKDQKSITIKNYGFDKDYTLSLEDINYLDKKTKSSLLVYEEVSEKKLKDFLHDHNVYIAIPLKTSAGLQGIMVLGEKASGDIYNSQDLNILEIFAPPMAIAIQNSLAFDEIARFNITLRQKIKDATSDLRKANLELRHLNKLKDEFVFISTHELKTPVTVLKGYMAMINDGNYGQVNDKLQEPLKEMQGATGQLVQLVNDLLEIARSEAKTLQIQTSPIEICSVIDNSLEGLRTLAQQKGLELNHDCRPKQIYAMADPDRIREILNNLVSNAIKYSDTGTITIDHVIEGDHVITHVKDQGVGIDEKDQSKIFTRFFRADEQASKVPGTGLGLFIVKQIVEKMGGKIWFQSKLGKGTTFSFSLPKAKPPASN